MIGRILVNSFRRSARRKAIAMAALAVASAVWTLVLALGAGIGDRARRDLSAYGANIVVRPETAEGAPLPAPPAPQTLPESSLASLADLFWRNNLTGISPILRVELSDAGTTTVPAEGADFRRNRPLAGGDRLETGVLATHPAWKLSAGRWPADGLVFEAAAGGRLAQERGWRAGRAVTLRGPGGQGIVQIVGIFASGEREDEELLLPLPVAQRLAGLPGRISAIDIAALTTPESRVLAATGRDPRTLPPAEYDRWYCTPYASSIAHQITEAIPGARAVPVWRVTAAEQRSAAIARTILLFTGAAALVAAFFAVFATLFDAVNERAPEIGLWKALGAEPEKVAAVFLAEAGITGAAGGALGAAIGLSVAPDVARAIFGFGVARPLPLAIVAAGAALLVSLAAALRPVRRALALDPILALRES
jgi:putative ABC transport system permease protein